MWELHTLDGEVTLGVLIRTGMSTCIGSLPVYLCMCAPLPGKNSFCGGIEYMFQVLQDVINQES